MAHFMSVGSGFYIFNTFMQPLCEVRGWTRTDVNLAIILGRIIKILGGLIYGSLVTRYGPRRLMTLGPIIGGLAFIFLLNSQWLWCFYVCSIILFIGNGSYGGVVANTAVNNWFKRRRGMAMGISTVGISLSGAVLPMIALWIFNNGDLTTSALCIGICILAMAPFAWFIVRDWPESSNSPSDEKMRQEFQSQQMQHITDKNPPDNENQLIDLPALIKDSRFWRIGLSYGFMMTGVVGVMTQLKPYFSDIGFSHMEAMVLMSSTAFMGAVGKCVWGILLDYFQYNRIVAMIALLNAIGLSFALLKWGYFTSLCFVVVFGFAMGGVLSTLPVIVASNYGRKSFPFVFKYISVFLILEVLGLVIAGQSFDRLGSYDFAYIVFIAFNCIAAFIIWEKSKSTKKRGRSCVEYVEFLTSKVKKESMNH
jgi:OFA family oxalate/formate antiporter-like MFS transporter